MTPELHSKRQGETRREDMHVPGVFLSAKFGD